MTTPYKLNVRIGEYEFNAEGSEQTVKEQFDLFLTAIKYSAPPSPKQNQEKPHATDPTNGHPNGKSRQLPDGDRVTLDRIFAIDSDDVISLKALPKTTNADSDGLVMLLYGFLRLTQKGDVYAPTLMAAARQSGIQTERMYRVIAANSQYINTAGQKRGTRYSLNNRGQAYAMELIDGVLTG